MRRDQSKTHHQTQFESLEARIVLSAHSVLPFAVSAEDMSASHDATVEVAPSIDQTIVDADVDWIRNEYGFRGAGQTVAVIDTGIAWDHYALGGGWGEGHRVVGGWDFAENDANPYDDGPGGFHGTHVAGIVGSSDKTFQGVAPEADLVALRVFDDYGLGDIRWVEQALQWVHDHRDSFENPITTVNLSLGAHWNSEDIPSWATLEEELAQLKNDGIFVAVAAGNSFASFQEVGLSYPAVSEHVVPVASHDGESQLSDFSQRHDRVLVAPGESVQSTVPNHLFGLSSPSNRFLSASGTSMAAPYVAGASVLLREAMEFAGYDAIDQARLYEHFQQTADEIWDSATSATYRQIDLGAALETLLQDKVGDEIAAAFRLDSLTDGESIEGTIERVSDRDVFEFRAAANGRITLDLSATHNLDARWETFGLAVDPSDHSVSFDVFAGETYHFAIGTSAGIGHYSIDVDFEAADTFVYVDWGEAAFQSHRGQEVTGDQWYRLAATRNGLLTVESLFERAEGEIDITVYDAQLQQVGTSAANATGTRIDANVTAGDVLFVKASGIHSDVTFRVMNLVDDSGDQWFVHGTQDNDVFQVDTSDGLQVSINGVAYHWQAGAEPTLRFAGGEGDDRLHLIGSTADELLSTRGAQVEWSSDRMHVVANDIENVNVDGGGGEDRATHYGSENDELFSAAGRSSWYRSDQLMVKTQEFDRTRVFGGGGDDRAEFYSTPDADRLVARDNATLMRGDDYQNAVEDFRTIVARGNHALEDRVILHDTAGDDRFVARPGDVQLDSQDRSIRAIGFHSARVIASAGHDVAELHGSAQDDVLIGRVNYSQLRADDYRHQVIGFDEVTAIAGAGGSDSARLWDSAGDDHARLSARHAELSSDQHSLSAIGFARTTVQASTGNDLATLHDSPGVDRFYVTSNSGMVRGTDYAAQAHGFDSYYAYSQDDRDRLLGAPEFAQSLRFAEWQADVRDEESSDETNLQSLHRHEEIAIVDRLFAESGRWDVSIDYFNGK